MRDRGVGSTELNAAWTAMRPFCTRRTAQRTSLNGRIDRHLLTRVSYNASLYVVGSKDALALTVGNAMVPCVDGLFHTVFSLSSNTGDTPFTWRQCAGSYSSLLCATFYAMIRLGHVTKRKNGKWTVGFLTHVFTM
jgi:hypothetical protein